MFETEYLLANLWRPQNVPDDGLLLSGEFSQFVLQRTIELYVEPF